MYKMFKPFLLCFVWLIACFTHTGAQTTPCPTCLRSGVELVSNGNFEQGNIGFSNSYTFLQGPAPTMGAGFFTVIDNPNDIHSGFTACPDHTPTGAGNQMVVNGATQTNVTIWCQTINVVPNANYLFSTWVQSVVAGNPALLQFSINGITLGSPFSPPAATCQWVEFFTSWNSGTNTTATICIVNQNTTGGGNDFSLDDISFMECTPIQPLNVQVFAQNPNCHNSNNGTAATLFSQPWGGVPPYSLLWSTGDTTATIDSLAPGNYYLSVLDSIGCANTAFFSITAPPDYTVDLGPDILSCFGDSIILQNLATGLPGSITYVWGGFGQADSITADTSGTYILAGIVDQCVKRDTINITISPDFTVDIGPVDTTFCTGGGINLNAGNPGATYLWSTGDTTYLLSVDSAGLYWVNVTFDGICTKSDSIFIGEILCTSIVYVPNVFTPNGDGSNDKFTAQFSGIVKNVSIKIFNRWGLQVFKDDKINFAWDGTVNGGANAADGVYYWIMIYTDNNDSEKQLTGTVTLIGG